MTRGVIFWVIMLLWVLAVVGFWADVVTPRYYTNSRDVLLLVLFGLLGWKVYGPAIKGD